MARFVRQVIRSALLRSLPRHMLIDRGPSRDRCLYLTFDDGPHPDHTPVLLDALARFSLRATFFVVGREAEAFPEIVKRIADEGHSLGTHSWSHAPAAETDASRLLEETRRTSQLIGELTGVQSRLCRPPYGAVSARKLISLWRAGQTCVLWSNDPQDFQCRTDDELRNRVEQTQPVAGDIVLLHDKFPAISRCVDVYADLMDRLSCQSATIDELVPQAVQSGPEEA